MLAKIGSLFLEEEKVVKWKKICRVLFLLGIIFLFSIPFLAEDCYLTEKLMKNSPVINIHLSRAFFEEAVKEYNKTEYDPKSSNTLLSFAKRPFAPRKSFLYNQVFSHTIRAPRGDRKKLLLINLIYDPISLSYPIANKANSYIYAFMKFLSNQDNISWLSKNIQFNYISYKLFYDNVFEAFELICNGKYNKEISHGAQIEAIINVDLNRLDFEHFESYLIKANGMNGELIDMDFYKAFLEDLQSSHQSKSIFFTNNEKVLDDELKRSIRRTFSSIGNVMNTAKVTPRIYASSYVYLIENIMNNFFLYNTKINLNHMLITKGINSILLSINSNSIPSTGTSILPNLKPYSLMASFERSIKTMSKNEIDLFRGNFHYLLIDPNKFIGYMFLALPILMILRTFYELVWTIYQVEYKEISKKIQAGKVISGCLFSFMISSILFLHIDDFMKLFKFDINSCPFVYNFMTLFFIANSGLVFILLNLTYEEMMFIDNILRFFLALNCFNFIFINIGIGMVLTFTMLSLEFAIIWLRSRSKQFASIFLIGFFIYLINFSTTLVFSMMINYFTYRNNVYVILTITNLLLCSRFSISLFITKHEMTRKEDQKEEEKKEEKIKTE